MDHFRSHSRAGNSNKWSEKARRKRRGKQTRLLDGEEDDFQLSPAGHVWPNRKWQGAFERLDREHLKLVTVYPLQQVSQTILHTCHGQATTGALWCICGDLKATCEVSQLSAFPSSRAPSCWLIQNMHGREMFTKLVVNVQHGFYEQNNLLFSLSKVVVNCICYRIFTDITEQWWMVKT